MTANAKFPVRLIVAGSRTFKDVALFKSVLEELLSNFNRGEVELVSGMASAGPDKMVVDYAKDFKYPLKEFPADWNAYGKSAGMRRNAEMANYATHLLAFWDGESSGTANMLDVAGKKGLGRYAIYFDREAQDNLTFIPCFSARIVKDNKLIRGKSIFRDEARCFNNALGRIEFPKDKETFPWEQIVEAIKKIRTEAQMFPPGFNHQALHEFLDFLEKERQWVSSHRLPVIVNEPSYQKVHPKAAH